MFPKLNPGLPLPLYEHLSLDQGSMVAEALERRRPEQEYERIRSGREAVSHALSRVVQTSFETGLPDPRSLDILAAAEAHYLPMFFAELRRDTNADILAAFSRAQFDVTPVRHRKKHNLNNHIGAHTSAMFDVFPGSDRAHRDLLMKHRALFHFARIIPSYGAVLYTPPGADELFIDQLLDDLQQTNPDWLPPPRFFTDTPVKVVRQVFAHYDEDWPATVETTNGEVLGVLTQRMIRDAGDEELVLDHFDSAAFKPLSNSHPQEAAAMTSVDAAYDLMKHRSRDHLFRMSEKGEPLAMPKSHAVLRSLLPAFTHNEGLGCMVYVGVNNPEEAKRTVAHLAKRKVAGVQVEAANGFMGSMLRLIQELRDAHPDLFIGTGAVNSPEAVRQLAPFVDMIKGPIGSGGVCNTYHTGVRMPDAYAGMLLCAASAGDVPILLDGIGGGRSDDHRYDVQQYDDTSEFVIAHAFPNMIGKQGGGAMIARRESSNPVFLREGRLAKKASGEASAAAARRKHMGKSLSRHEQKRVDARALYSEGVNDKWYPLRKPETVGQFLDLLAFRLRTAMSYTFGMVPESRQPGDHMRLFQEQAKVVHKG